VAVREVEVPAAAEVEVLPEPGKLAVEPAPAAEFEPVLVCYSGYRIRGKKRLPLSVRYRNYCKMACC